MIETKISDDLMLFSSRLMVASSKAEQVSLIRDLTEMIGKVVELEERGSNALITQSKACSATIKFTKQETLKMDSEFRKEFVAGGLVAHVVKRESGKNTYCYEIRYRRNGYNISVSSNDLQEAKRKFIEKTKSSEIEKCIVSSNCKKQSFENLFYKWIESKKGEVTEKTLERYESYFSKLPMSFRRRSIKEIKTYDLIAQMPNTTCRKYEDLRCLFNGVFKFAMINGIIVHNPVGLVSFKRSERKTRNALSEEEIVEFLERIKRPEFERIRQGAYLLYFFGLRPCEVDEETRREGDFLIVRNRKRKHFKIEYKKIPIPQPAEKLIDWNKPLTFNCSECVRADLFKTLLGENTAYCLRHTFATICQQYVRPDIVDIWMGDSPQRLVGKVYTHFPDKFMKEQMENVKFI